MDLPIRLLLAFATGVALAFVLDYLDDSVRDRSELESAGCLVVAEIPSLGVRGRLP
jgi:capsular polysaccharide biosynthesis protein